MVEFLQTRDSDAMDDRMIQMAGDCEWFHRRGDSRVAPTMGPYDAPTTMHQCLHQLIREIRKQNSAL